jgi:hypothetical protein
MVEMVVAGASVLLSVIDLLGMTASLAADSSLRVQHAKAAW